MACAAQISYLDPGATCVDSKDGDISDQVDAEVPDVSKKGKHIITYKCTNSAKKTTTKTRVVFTKVRFAAQRIAQNAYTDHILP